MAVTLENETAKEFTPQREILCRFVFAFIFFFLLYYLYSNTLLHQLRSPVQIFPYVDITYWIFHLLKIPEFFSHNYILACCFDALLFITCILSFLFPGKRIYIATFFLLYCIYYITYNSYGNQHTHSKVGILLIPLPFMVPARMFTYMWEAMRYFTLFIYADAFLWKLARGNFLAGDHGILVVKKNFSEYLFYNPDGFITEIYTWLLRHPVIIQAGFITGLIMEGLFIAGFFTRRYDNVLFLISVLLPFGFMVFSDAFFFEMLVLSMTLYKHHNISDPPVSRI